MNGIQRMDHFTVVTDRLDETCAFYECLGLNVGPRPDFGIPGLWLYAGGHPVLHLVQTLDMPAVRRGALDHMAFFGGDIVATLTLLKSKRIAYRCCACHDPGVPGRCSSSTPTAPKWRSTSTPRRRCRPN